jgi:AraC-like DNA-binding protein
MKSHEHHQGRVVETPWPGIFGTHIDSARHFGRHWHSTHGFGLLEHGAQRSASGRGVVDAHAGDIITTNPGEVHDGRPLGGPTRRWRMLYMEPGVIGAMAGEPGADGTDDVEFTRPAVCDPALSGVVQQLFARLERWRSARSPTDAQALACEEALVRACGVLLERHATAAPVRDAGGDMQPVRERLADDLLAAPSLAELAAMTGLSRYQLLRRFEKACGLPPHAWLLQQRAEHARGLIRAGSSLADAAAASGFADQSHMTRLFARQFGFTPGAWQRVAASMGHPQ